MVIEIIGDVPPHILERAKYLLDRGNLPWQRMRQATHQKLYSARINRNYRILKCSEELYRVMCHDVYVKTAGRY